MELFELMQEPSGATSAAIREKPHLMSLQYVRAEAPTLDDHEGQEDAIAVMVREFIETAAGALDKLVAQREHADADNATAARYLLALEQGTAAMPLHERRKRAAECLHMEDVASLRHQYKTKRSGLTETRETKLMDAIADRLKERETDFLKDSRAQDSAPSASSDSPLLAIVSDLWEVAQNLHNTIGYCVGIWRTPPGEEYPGDADYEALYILCRFWQLVRIPSQNDPFIAQMDSPSAVALHLFPEGSVVVLWVLTPVERRVMEQIVQTDFWTSFKYGWPQFVHDLIPLWHGWLWSCECDFTTQHPDCLAHGFLNALDNYIKHLEKCWRELRDPYHSPLSYKSHRTSDELIQYYAINLNVDKYTKNSV